MNNRKHTHTHIHKPIYKLKNNKVIGKQKNII
jgi:hypothetical protein